MQIVVKELDQTRIRYEAMVQKVGQGAATQAFSRALNHEGRKGFTAVKRALRKQTSIPPEIINAALQFRSSSRTNLRTIIGGSGSELPLRFFKPKQFKYGVRAKVWGRFQTYKSNFIVASRSGNVFHRVSKKRLPIQRSFGPSVPKEMVKDASLEAFDHSSSEVMARAMHELSRLLKV